MKEKDGLNKNSASQIEDQILKVKEFFVEFTNKVIGIDGKKLGVDFSFSQLKALSAFKEEKEYTMGELARNIQVAMPAMTDMIDSLEKEGIVQRNRDEEDRRIVKVRLMDRGKVMRREFMEIRRRELEETFKRLSQKDWNDLISYLEKACQILQKINLHE